MLSGLCEYPMGSTWRSEDMILVQIVMQREAAHETVFRLGELNCVQFKDLSQLDKNKEHSWEKKYISEIRRCIDLESKVDYFEKLLAEVQAKHDYDFDIMLDSDFHLSRDLTLDEVEDIFQKRQTEMKSLKQSLAKLYSEISKSQELIAVIEKGSSFISIQDVNSTQEITGTGGLQYVCGVINNTDISTFQMVLYRQTRGNMVFKSIPIDEPIFDGLDTSGKLVFAKKSVYLCFLSSGFLREKVLKQCKIATHVYEMPNLGNKVEICNVEKTKISQLEETIKVSNDRLKTLLSETCLKLDTWKKFVAVEKSIYDTMNKFDYTVANSAVCEAWIPKKMYKEVKAQVELASSRAQVESHMDQVKTHEKHPTYIPTNKVTQVFQDMTDAYSTPAYKEINPSPVTMITFPFLFAVMFGDLGHATLLFMASLLLVVFEEPIRETMESNELLIMLYQGRYLLLMMSIFALYTGLLYNDVFGLSLNLFGPRWKFDGQGKGVFTGETYEFGMDPSWYETSNKLMMYNSVKMKMAIIFGVCHMLLGTVLKFLNFLHFRDFAHVFMEAIPEFLILSCSFGYLCFMIIFKWCIDWQSTKSVAPDLLKTMTDFFLHFYDPINPALYGGQQWVQITLLVICVLAVPCLLIPTPIYHIVMHYLNKKSHSDDDEDFSIQEIVIHQIIHTIEYVLGAVSNTASYLRLWALSLAHAQLSEVFFSLTIKLVLTLPALIPNFVGKDILIKVIDYSGIPLTLAFGLWLGLTLAVLLGMETLSAFLHALRLHWVEFNSKYFKGEGIPFAPLSFVQLLKETRARVVTNE